MNQAPLNVETSRRDVLQKIFMAGIATSIFGAISVDANAGTNDNSDPVKPFYLPPAKPLELESKGINMRTVVRTSQTNMQYSSVEFIVAPKQMGPPPHIHKELDELMYVLEGTVSIMVEETVYEVKAGGWHMRPRGITHTFWNGTSQPARYIDMYFNQNFEDFLEELNFKLIPEMASRKLTPADPGIAAKWADLDKRFGITTFFEKRQPIIDKYKLKA